jgi:hypothetical protein
MLRWIPAAFVLLTTMCHSTSALAIWARAESTEWQTDLSDHVVIASAIEMRVDMKPDKSSVVRHLLSWHTGDARLNDAVERGTLDVPAILKRLSEQTGLTFSEKARRGRFLLIENSSSKEDSR